MANVQFSDLVARGDCYTGHNCICDQGLHTRAMKLVDTGFNDAGARPLPEIKPSA